MSSELRALLALRRARILADRAAIDAILGRRPGMEPDGPDLAGLAWLLGAIYNEVEEVLKGVAKLHGEALPSTNAWHRDLLEQMSAPTSTRVALLPVSLRAQLDEFRAFRHASRHATFLELDWPRMEPLFVRLPSMLDAFFAACDAFVDGAG